MAKSVHIKAGGGVVFREEDEEIWVLLIKRRGIWDLPKGKLDEGEEIAACAIREVQEEVGISHAEITAELGTTEHRYEENGQTIDKTTYWYSMQTNDDEFAPQAEEEITEIAWLPVNNAIDLVGYNNLKTILKRFIRVFGEK